MVLTGIVVAVSATALGLALAGRIHQSHAETDASTLTEETDHGPD
jgi:multisubunit Na+/H+ antiporter MnhC subunit